MTVLISFVDHFKEVECARHSLDRRLHSIFPHSSLRTLLLQIVFRSRNYPVRKLQQCTKYELTLTLTHSSALRFGGDK